MKTTQYNNRNIIKCLVTINSNNWQKKIDHHHYKCQRNKNKISRINRSQCQKSLTSFFSIGHPTIMMIIIILENPNTAKNSVIPIGKKYWLIPVPTSHVIIIITIVVPDFFLVYPKCSEKKISNFFEMLKKISIRLKFVGHQTKSSVIKYLKKARIRIRHTQHHKRQIPEITQKQPEKNTIHVTNWELVCFFVVHSG